MKKTFMIMAGLGLYLSLGSLAQAQQTLIDIDPIGIYNEAFELFENQKYGASSARFSDYKNEGDAYLLKAQSDLNTAIGAMEMRLKNTEELFIYYLNKYPELSEKDYVYFKLGKYNFDKRKYKNSLEWLTKIEYPGFLDLEDMHTYHFMMGYNLYKEEEYDKAVKYFSKVDGNKNPYYNLANYYKGYIFYQQGKYEEALEKFVRIKSESRFNKLMPVYITHVYLNLKEYDKVIDYGEKALEMPKVEKSQNIKSFIAEACFYKRDYSKAVRYYEELRDARFSLTSNDHYHYGYALFRAKEYEKAIGAFNHISMNKDAIGQNIAYLLGTAYLMTDDKFKARNSFGFASKLDFDKTIQETSALNYAKLSYELNFHKESVNALRDFLKDYPASEYKEEAKSLIGKILLSTADFKEAMHIIENMEDRNRDIEAAYQKVTYFAGLDYFQNRNFSQSKNLFIKSIKTPINDRYKALAYFWLGESYYNLGEYEDAIREYRNYLFIGVSKQTPYYSIAYYNIAYCHYKSARYEDARTYFDKYLELEKSNKATQRLYDVILRLADCNFALKSYSQAISYYDLNISKGNQEIDYALFQLGTIQGLTGNNEAKLASLNRIIRQYPNSTYVDDAMFEIANMYFIAEEYTTSKSKFENLIKQYPKNKYYVSALLKIALANYNLGNVDPALSQLENLIKQYPYAPEAQEAFNAFKSIYVDEGRGKELLPKIAELPKVVNISESEEETIQYNSAFSYIKKEKYKEAIPEFEEYLEKFPNGYYAVKAHYYTAMCASYIQNDSKALEHYEAVNRMTPNEYFEKTLKASAQLYYKAGDFEKAAERFRQLEGEAVIKENIQLSLLGQMRSYFKTGRYEDCIVYADKVLAHPHSNSDHKTEANYHKGKANLELKNYDIAQSILEMVANENKAQMGAESKYLVAYIYYLKEDYDNTISTIVALKNDYPGNDFYIAKGFILLSDVFVKMGDLFQAKHTLESIIANYEGEAILKSAKEKLEKIEEMEKQAQKELIESENNFIEIDSDSIK